MWQDLSTRRCTLQRKYPNLKEGTLDHEGVSYEQPATDGQYVMTVEFGNLLHVDDSLEVWVWQGMAVVLRNEVGILE